MNEWINYLNKKKLNSKLFINNNQKSNFFNNKKQKSKSKSITKQKLQSEFTKEKTNLQFIRYF